MERRSILVSPRLRLSINQVKQVHARIITHYQSLKPIFIEWLLNLSLTGYARNLFDEMPKPNPSLYNLFIAAYSRKSLNKEAVDMFILMHSNNAQIFSLAIPPVVKSCSALSAIELGKQIHSLAVHCGGFDGNLFSQTAFMDFYAKSADLGCARLIFHGIAEKDPISYNCLISAYAKSGNVLAARELFDEMPERTVVSWNSMMQCYAHIRDQHEAMSIFERMQAEKFEPNGYTFVILLSVCAKMGDLDMGLKVKKFIDDSNMFKDMIVTTALLEMFVKCGAVDYARQEFDRMNKKDIVAWGAMIAGYTQNGRSREALQLFECILKENIKVNDVTIASVLTASAQLGSIETGEWIGSYVESEGYDTNQYVSSALLSMYSRCGNIDKALQIFDKMPEKDVASWNSMITGLAFNGRAMDAINLFEEMKKSKVDPNDITFVVLLTACTHVGLVDLGLEFFHSMSSIHSIIPKIEHCSCIVDLFCRSGRLKEAYEFICKMVVEPNVVIWGTLLSASRTHSNTELAELSVKKLQALEPENSGNYVLLSNTYANSGRWWDSLTVRNSMRDKKVQKSAAYSWIELENKVHEFLVSDSSHPRSDDIYNMVEGLTMQSGSDESDIYNVYSL
ncbi:hypothetical protein Dimus_008530 [Dionaea muscipula]